MQLTIDAADLRWIVTHAARGVPSRPLNPAMAGVWLAAEGDTLNADGYDYDTLTAAGGAATVGEPGRVLVPGRLLAAMVGHLDGVVTVATDGPRLRLSAKGVRYSVALMDEAGYPGLPPMSAAYGQVDAAHLTEAVELAATSARAATNAPWWYGAVRFEDNGNGLLVGSTDTVSATRAFVPWAEPPTRSGAGVGDLAARLALDTLKGTSGRVAVILDEVHTGLIVAGRSTLVRRQTGWPRWREIVDASTTVTPLGVVHADRRDLLAAMGRCAAAMSEVTDLDAHAVLDFAADGLTYTVAGVGGAECEGEVAIELAGEPLRIGVWPAYLRDAVAAIDAEVVEVTYTGPMRPMVIREPGGEEFHLAMPKRLRAVVAG